MGHAHDSLCLAGRIIRRVKKRILRAVCYGVIVLYVMTNFFLLRAQANELVAVLHT